MNIPVRLSSPPDIADRASRALIASTIAASVVWIGANWDFSWDSLPNFFPGPFGSNTVIFVFGLVALLTFAVGPRAWPILWGIMIPAHVLLIWHNAGTESSSITALEAIATELASRIGDWCVLAAGLLVAAWVARFRDGLAGFRELVLPGVSLLALANYVGIVNALVPARPGTSYIPVAWIVTSWTVCGLFPLAFNLWQMRSTARNLSTAKMPPDLAKPVER